MSPIRIHSEIQERFEARVMRVYAHARVQDAVVRARELFLADPSAQTADGRTTLEDSLGELVRAALVNLLRGEQLVWTTLPPHSWFGVEMGGSRWGADNPDNVYVTASIDEGSRYRISGELRGPLPSDATITLGGTGGPAPEGLPDDVYEAGWSRTVALLRLNDIEPAADGSFAITIDPDPAGGRAHHMRSEPGTTELLVRHTLSDWTAETPPSLELERIGDARAPGAATDDELAERAAKRLSAFVPFVLSFKQASFYRTSSNTFTPLVPTPGGLANQVTAFGNFELADDQALVVHVDPVDASYLGFQLTDPWMVSTEHIQRTGSLNSAQALSDADGTRTYVISPRDPGVHNWLDTSGLNQGCMLIRWQEFPGGPQPLPPSAVRAERVELSKLADSLPRITAEQRREQLRAREEAFARRIAAYS